MAKTISDQDYNFFLRAVRRISEYDLTDYSDKSLKRRIDKILSDNKTDIYSLISDIKRNKNFLEKIIRGVTVNTTELFRDPVVWHDIRHKVLQKLTSYPAINIWHAGCSTGQEVYSMLILMNEVGLLDKARVLATDINSDVLEVAGSGTYKYRFNRSYLDNFDSVIRRNPLNYNDTRDVPYSKYFTIDKDSDTLAIKPFLLEKPVYKKHDLVSTEKCTPGKFDLIICRNVIIYFNYSLQNRIFKFFYDSLHPGGFLILGMHESIDGPMSKRFIKSGHTYSKPEKY